MTPIDQLLHATVRFLAEVDYIAAKPMVWKSDDERFMRGLEKFRDAFNVAADDMKLPFEIACHKRRKAHHALSVADGAKP